MPSDQPIHDIFERMQKRTLKRDFKGSKNKEQHQRGDDNRKQWMDIVKDNADFEEYYKAQKVCPEEEWDTFMDTLRKPLPLTFRINGSGRFAHDLRSKLETDFFSGFAQGPIMIDGEEVQPPMPLPWYPKKLAWQLEFSRAQLRKVELLKNLHEFMKREHTIGSITRQEAVSMVPPLYLDVQPHHRVLDMCAAPGSKTYQLLEAIHAQDNDPTGLVIANDADVQRCNMLTHQAQRFRSPALIVTNHDGQSFPRVFDLDPASTETYVRFDRILADVPCSGDGTLRKAPDMWNRWQSGFGNGLHIIQLQIALRACEMLRVGGRMVYSTCTFNPVEDEAVVAEVLRRCNGGMVLLDMSDHLPALKRRPGMTTWKIRDKEGWYDTWEQGKKGHKLYPSMFPGSTEESLPLERCMRFLPHDQNTGGFFVAVLEKVAEIDEMEYPSTNQSSTHISQQHQSISKKRKVEAPNDGEGGEGEDGGVEGVEAPPAVSEGRDDITKELQHKEEAKQQKQERKRRPTPPKILPAWGTSVRSSPPPAKPGKEQRLNAGRWHGVDVIMEYINEEEIKKISNFYGLGPQCPILGALVARTREDKPRKLNYVGPGVKSLVLMDTNEQLKIPFLGLKLFEKQERKDAEMACPYRIAQDGLPCILPYVTQQIFYPTLDEFIHLLQDRSLGLPESCKLLSESMLAKKNEVVKRIAEDEVSGDEAPADQSNAKETGFPKAKFFVQDEDSINKVKGMGLGCCIATMREEDLRRLDLKDDTGEGALMANAPFALSCWRGRGTLNALVGREECSQMLDRLLAAQALLGVAKVNKSDPNSC